jgi:hypothetical protein
MAALKNLRFVHKNQGWERKEERKKATDTKQEVCWQHAPFRHPSKRFQHFLVSQGLVVVRLHTRLLKIVCTTHTLTSAMHVLTFFLIKFIFIKLLKHTLVNLIITKKIMLKRQKTSYTPVKEIWHLRV